MKYYCLIIVTIILSQAAYSQLTAREVFDHRIRSIETRLLDETGKLAITEKIFYSKAGWDSVVITNGKPAFTYRQKLNEQKMVKQLIRNDHKGREDELQLFEYNDSGFTVEVIAHGAGTVAIRKFNKARDCYEEIIESTDTVLYKINKQGKVETVSSKQGAEIVSLVITEFDQNGYPLTSRSGQDGKQIILRHKNTAAGLPEQTTWFELNGNKETLLRSLHFVYEYYK